MTVLTNPECQAGKHHNCDGTSWDNDTDALTGCPCTCHAAALLPTDTTPTKGTTMNQPTNQLELLETITLSHGSHRSFTDGACLLEAASYIANEPFSDHPACVDPIIGAYGRRLNDLLPADARQELKQYIPAMLKTADDGKSDARRYILADWATRVSLPRWLDLAGRTQDAARLRALTPITDMVTYSAARRAVRELYPNPYQARADAYALLRHNVRKAVRTELAKTNASPVAVAAVVAAVAAVAEAAAVAAAEVAVAAAVAAEVAVAVAEAVAAFSLGSDQYWKFRRDVREAIRARLDSLDAAIPGTFAYARAESRKDAIDLLGRLVNA